MREPDTEMSLLGDSAKDRREPAESAKEEPLSLNFFDGCSRVQHPDNKGTIVYYFDYNKSTKDETVRLPETKENIDWEVLLCLKQNDKWEVMKHPMVLNYINERLLDCTLFYTLHIFAFAFFLLLLSSHIFSRSKWKDCVITVFLLVFIFFMILKGAVNKNRLSFWFLVTYGFNILTYAATFCYVWLPTVFSFDDYHQKEKNEIMWFLPIVAIISAWLNFLYILRKSRFGIYIFMMVRILRSFAEIAIIWIPTLIVFSFTFHLTMKDSTIKPWQYINENANATNLLVILQAITKTSSMMIGEIDANDILSTPQWIPSILVLIFEIITVILLMNLMVSLAVGDVSDLRKSAQDTLLKVKANFVIEALQLSKISEMKCLKCSVFGIHKRRTKNMLVVDSDGGYHSHFRKWSSLTAANKGASPEEAAVQGASPGEAAIQEASPGEAANQGASPGEAAVQGASPGEAAIQGASPAVDYERSIGLGKSFNMRFSSPGMKMRVRPLQGSSQTVFFKNCAVELWETTDSNIPLFQEGVDILEEKPAKKAVLHEVLQVDNWSRLDLLP